MDVSDLFKSRDELNLLDGPIGKNLFYLSLPIVITNLLRTAYNLADTFWLGRVGEDALAAITFAFPIVFLLISSGIGLAVAGSVLVAQHEGKGQEKGSEYAASQTLGFGLVISTLIGIVGYFIVDDLVALLGADPNVAAMATSYLQIVSLGLVFMFGFSIFIALMRGYGDTVTPMLLMLVTVIFNIILDPFLIFGWWVFPELGIAGAAVATIACRGFATITGIAILATDFRGVTIQFHHVIPEFSFAKKILRIGVPASVESMGTALSVNVLVAIVGMFANSIVAGFGIGIRIFSVVFLPADALSRGVEAMTGQNIGAENFSRARRVNIKASKYGFGILSGLGLICFIWAEPIIGIFSTSQAVIEPGATFLRFVAPTFGLLAIIRSLMGGFRGVGKTLTAAAISISFVGVFRLPIAYFGAVRYGEIGVWVSFPLSIIVGAILAIWLFYRDTWEENIVEEHEEEQ